MRAADAPAGPVPHLWDEHGGSRGGGRGRRGRCAHADAVTQGPETGGDRGRIGRAQVRRGGNPNGGQDRLRRNPPEVHHRLGAWAFGPAVRRLHGCAGQEGRSPRLHVQPETAGCPGRASSVDQDRQPDQGYRQRGRSTFGGGARRGRPREAAAVGTHAGANPGD